MAASYLALVLPNSLSQLGPGVSWFDIDRDGDVGVDCVDGSRGPAHADLLLGRGDGHDARRERRLAQRRLRPGFLKLQSKPLLGIDSGQIISEDRDAR